MEFNKIDALLEKYFIGETSIDEENELKDYFFSANVAPHLEQYKPLFGYFAETKEEKLAKNVSLSSKKSKMAWLSIAASIAVLIGVGTYTYFSAGEVKENSELGTYDNPEEAFEATQKALAMLSNNVNVGVEGVHYLEVYQVTKEKVFVE